MSKKTLIFFVIFYLPSALAEAAESEDFRVLYEVKNQQEKPEAVMLVREDGHLLGQPYQVELRVRCQSLSDQPLEWPIKDSFSVCDLSPESVKVNLSKTAVALKTKMVDLANYEQQLDLGLSAPQATCEEATTVKKFSLRHLCSNK